MSDLGHSLADKLRAIAEESEIKTRDDREYGKHWLAADEQIHRLIMAGDEEVA